MSTWRDERNQKARARLEKRLSALFPGCVLAHALRQPLIPPTQRRAVESYWRHRPLMADRLARALAARSGQPAGWEWRLGSGGETGLATSFRVTAYPSRRSASSSPPWRSPMVFILLRSTPSVTSVCAMVGPSTREPRDMTTSPAEEQPARPTWRDLRDPVRLLALGFGSGLAPAAPGTAGSLVGLAAALIAAQWGAWIAAAITGLVVLFGIYLIVPYFHG